jgi:hypothetical protein
MIIGAVEIMPTPTISVLGVYKPSVSEDVYREQWQVTESDEQTKEHFDNLVLIEAVIDHLDSRFKTVDLGQPSSDGDVNRFQCAYDEALLSSDGNSVLARNMDCVSGLGPLRFAFYLHCYDPARPLHWSYGEVACPRVPPVPDRLKKLIPYNACS